MRRREFLGRTATLAGGAALAGDAARRDSSSQAAARVQAAVALPSPRNMPIDTFVVLMMENRSFDHYFGWHPRARRPATRPQLPRRRGQAGPDASPDAGLPGLRLPRPRPLLGRRPASVGTAARWRASCRATRRATAATVRRRLLPEGGPRLHPPRRRRVPALRPLLLLDDGLHLPQPPLHVGGAVRRPEEQHDPGGRLSATSGRRSSTARIANGRQRRLLPHRPAVLGALRRARRELDTARCRHYYARAAAGTLPNISFVDPPFRDGGGGDGLSADEHPHGDIRLGQAFMSDVVHAFMESPQFRRGALFIVYDEWGGFFDHVAPRFVPDDRRNRRTHEDYGLSGLPRSRRWPCRRSCERGARQPRDLHVRVDPEADLLQVRARLPQQAPPLRVQHRPHLRLGQARLRAAAAAGPGRRSRPRPARPAAALARRSARRSTTSAALETSGYLDRLGYEVELPTYGRTFRAPDRVKRALRRSTGG